MNPVGFSVPSLGCFSPSFIIGYQWVDKDNSFAFLHFACGVSWLPALPFPVQGPQEDPLRGRACLRSVAAGWPLSHRLQSVARLALTRGRQPLWLHLIANELSGGRAFSSAPFVFPGRPCRLDACFPCLPGTPKFFLSGPGCLLFF